MVLQAFWLGVCVGVAVAGLVAVIRTSEAR
jgi:hypothetical protein